MEKYIATWVYLDSPEEKSNYYNTGGDSTSSEFQAVYWRCIVLFYETSLRFHQEMKHLFFTNTKIIPIIDGLDIAKFFRENDITVISLTNLFPLPQNYFSSFRNQFFEFTIIDYLSQIMSNTDMLILLDSDCVFSKSLAPAFAVLSQTESSAMTYVVDYLDDYEIHGVTGDNMRQISKELGLELDKNPYYSGGELLFAKGSFFKYVASDFKTLYDNMIERHEQNRNKFNEEAHVLSYYYYKLNANVGGMDSYIKRMWTNQNYFRNIEPGDTDFTIWHLPNEKRAGIDKLFNLISNGNSLRTMDLKLYRDILENSLLLASNHKRNYYLMFKAKVNGLFRTLKIIGK